MRVLLTEFKAKDKAPMLRCRGLAEGDITDEFERRFGDSVEGLVCLDPKTPTSTTPEIAINPTAPTNTIHFLIEG